MRKFNKKKLPSRHTSLGPDRAPHRSFYYAMGETEKDVSKPFIGVVSTWNEAAPCNIALMRQAQSVKKGVRASKQNFLGTDIEAVYEYEGDLKNLIKKGFTPPVASQFYNLSILKEINGYNKNVNSGVDHDLWIRLAKVGVNIKYVSKVLSLPNANKKQLIGEILWIGL